MTMGNTEIERIQQRLELGDTDPELAKQYWDALEDHQGVDIRDGHNVVEVFRTAAIASCEGGLALATAYKELHELSGEMPRVVYFDDDLLRALKNWLPLLNDEGQTTIQWLLGSLEKD